MVIQGVYKQTASEKYWEFENGIERTKRDCDGIQRRCREDIWNDEYWRACEKIFESDGMGMWMYVWIWLEKQQWMLYDKPKCSLWDLCICMEKQNNKVNTKTKLNK